MRDTNGVGNADDALRQGRGANEKQTKNRLGNRANLLHIAAVQHNTDAARDNQYAHS